jgi:choice-of-anchor A domain-containing protein
MTAAFKTAVSAVAFAIASMSGAQAAVLNLDGYVGGANVFSFTNFSAPSADVEGAIMAGGNVDVSHYTTNLKDKDAYGHYSMIAGGSVNYNGGNIYNGDIYAGGGATLSAGVKSPGYSVESGTAPVDMSKLAAGLTNTSTELAAIAKTSAAEQKWGGIYITGSNKSVEIIDVDASWLTGSTYYNISGMAAGATLIVNVTGGTALLQGGYQAFDNYNTLFNFVDATALNINTGANVSILAPNAAVNGGQGVIDGTVIVKSWNSMTQINATNAFVSTEVQGLVTAVPEADTYAMLLGGLGLMGFIARRRKQAAAR